MAWNLKGALLQSAYQEDSALECFDKALELEPSNVVALNNRGFILHQKHRYKEALESLNKALELSGLEQVSQNIAITNEHFLAAEGEVEPEEESPGAMEEDMAGEALTEEGEEEATDTEEGDDKAGDSGASLLMCPYCGAFVSESATSCEQCGNAFDEEEEEVEGEPETDIQEEDEEVVEEGPAAAEVAEEDEEVEEENEEEGDEEVEGEDEAGGHEDLEEVIAKFTQISGIGASKAEALFEGGYTSYESLMAASLSDLTGVPGISESLAKSIKKQVQNQEFKDE
jgi:predicted flap endonuclease-1-like 5' DNA nuclease